MGFKLAGGGRGAEGGWGSNLRGNVEEQREGGVQTCGGTERSRGRMGFKLAGERRGAEGGKAEIFCSSLAHLGG